MARDGFSYIRLNICYCLDTYTLTKLLESIFLPGHNGAGKSTLINVLTGALTLAVNSFVKVVMHSLPSLHRQSSAINSFIAASSRSSKS